MNLRGDHEPLACLAAASPPKQAFRSGRAPTTPMRGGASSIKREAKENSNSRSAAKGAKDMDGDRQPLLHHKVE
jgi:hypothetical protein